MRQGKMMAEKMMVSVVRKMVGSNVNSACLWLTYQPKLPNGCEKLRK